MIVSRGLTLGLLLAILPVAASAASCPPHSEFARQITGEGEVRTFCRCLPGYDPKGDSCVRANRMAPGTEKWKAPRDSAIPASVRKVLSNPDGQKQTLYNLEQALRERPGNAAVRHAIAYVQGLQKGDALREFGFRKSTSPKADLILDALARSHGDWEGSLRYLEGVRERLGNDPHVEEALRYVRAKMEATAKGSKPQQRPPIAKNRISRYDDKEILVFFNQDLAVTLAILEIWARDEAVGDAKGSAMDMLLHDVMPAAMEIRRRQRAGALSGVKTEQTSSEVNARLIYDEPTEEELRALFEDDRIPGKPKKDPTWNEKTVNWIKELIGR